MSDPKYWNAWHGCKLYSEGCNHCYMYALDKARGVPEKSAIVAKTRNFNLPIVKNRKRQYKVPAGYFLRVNMTSDTFVEEAEPWLPEMWAMIRERSDVKFYILTKRAERMAALLPKDWGAGYENVQLNVTCENQRAFNERWPVLRDIPALHKGLNLSPLIGPVDVLPAVSTGMIEHIDLAGESYGGKRPCHYEWVKAVSDACKAHKVNLAFNATGDVFVKNGKVYHIDSKALQGVQAYRSDLSCFFGIPEYSLRHPVSHRILRSEELYHAPYNVHRCLHCTSFETCIGCQNCGGCRQVSLVSAQEILRLRAEERRG